MRESNNSPCKKHLLAEATDVRGNNADIKRKCDVCIDGMHAAKSTKLRERCKGKWCRVVTAVRV
jgi:hypothetical protein